MLTQSLTFRSYMEEVFIHLESLSYGQLVQDFNPNDVARSITHSIIIMFECEVSSRMCALCIYGMTWEEQIMPLVANSTKH